MGLLEETDAARDGERNVAAGEFELEFECVKCVNEEGGDGWVRLRCLRGWFSLLGWCG